MIGQTPQAAWACACGCSVFDVGGTSLLPQEGDHGGRVWVEWWHANQNRNWIGTSKASGDANLDKKLVSDWYALGFQYMFNREWGIMVKTMVVDRSFTTQTDPADPGSIATFRSRDFGDTEISAMYTGFSKDMSTGVWVGIKLPTGVYTAQGLDRDTQIGSGSTDLVLGAFHRGLLTGDNSWQYFAQVRALIPFLYRSSLNPDTGNYDVYKPGMQIDGAVGIVYNKAYNVLGFDKVAPVFQFILSHRNRDRGEAADPLNTGFDRIMIAPGIEFTKVIDEQKKRVAKLYFDVEIPIYYRVNAAINDDGSQGQLIAPIMTKLTMSYNF